MRCKSGEEGNRRRLRLVIAAYSRCSISGSDIVGVKMEQEEEDEEVNLL